MSTVSLVIAFLALFVSLWNSWYRVRDDARGRWWSRLTWALDRYSASTGTDVDRQLAWELLTYHLTTAPGRRNRDDQAMLDSMRRWLKSIAGDAGETYDGGPYDQESHHE